MTVDELKNKANSLPMSPGVYIMRDKSDNVIYIGKAKKLKNRVSQYFLDLDSHTPKTKLMVSRIHHFDVIIASSEFEALVLECSLIKQHLPKYNILLKDSKGYPYIRLDKKTQYPRITMVSKPAEDGALYFGPYGSRGTTQDIIDALLTMLKLPKCKKVFPRDIGKARPCLNYHMNQCSGWCMEGRSQQEYTAAIEQVRQLLSGNYKQVYTDIHKQMIVAAEEMKFELAAMLRDRLTAVDALGKKQLVTAISNADTDVIGFAQTEAKACLAVLHFSQGNLLDKEYEIFSLPDDSVSAVSSLVKQYYYSRGIAPKNIFLPFEIEDTELFSRLLSQQTGRKIYIRVPQRGDGLRLVEMAIKNAAEEAERVTTREEKVAGSLILLGKMLSIEPPHRIESYDISNISGTDIVAGMVVFEDGTPCKSDYKRFKIQKLDDQDDYKSMRQVLMRRFQHYVDMDEGFLEKPDLLLIDGGSAHAQVAQNVLDYFNLKFPVFGMVKDDRHRTRALVTPDDKLIRIDSQQAVFSLVGRIQEETHRFAIGYHKKLRSKRLRYSELDSIPGIGTKRKQDLLKAFRSLSAISAATLSELERILPKDAAMAVYEHYHSQKD